MTFYDFADKHALLLFLSLVFVGVIIENVIIYWRKSGK